MYLQVQGLKLGAVADRPEDFAVIQMDFGRLKPY